VLNAHPSRGRAVCLICLRETNSRAAVKLAHLASSAKLVAVEDMRSAKEQLQAAMVRDAALI